MIIIKIKIAKKFLSFKIHEKSSTSWPQEKKFHSRCSIKIGIRVRIYRYIWKSMANRRNEKRLGCSPSLVYGSGPLYARKIRRKFGRCSAIPNFYGAVTAPPVIPTYASRTGGGSSTRGSKCWTPHTRNNGAHLKTFTTPSAAFMSRVNLANSTDSFVGTECIPWPFVVSSSSAPRDKTTAQTAQQCDFETGIRKNSFLEFIIKKYFPRYARLSCWINWSNEIC